MTVVENHQLTAKSAFIFWYFALRQISNIEDLTAIPLRKDTLRFSFIFRRTRILVVSRFIEFAPQSAQITKSNLQLFS